jgi:hypothetical protein
MSRADDERDGGRVRHAERRRRAGVGRGVRRG